MWNDFVMGFASAFGARKLLGPAEHYETKYFTVHAPKRPAIAEVECDSKLPWFGTAPIDRALVAAFELTEKANDNEVIKHRLTFLKSMKPDVFWATPQEMIDAANTRVSAKPIHRYWGQRVQGLTVSYDASAFIMVSSFKPSHLFLANELLSISCWAFGLSGYGMRIPYNFEGNNWLDHLEEWQRANESYIVGWLRGSRFRPHSFKEEHDLA